MSGWEPQTQANNTMHYHLLPRRPLGCQAHRAGLRAGCVNHFLRKKGIDFWDGVASQTLLIERWGRRRGLSASTAPAVPVAAGLGVIGHRTTFEMIRRSQPFRLPPYLFLSLFGRRLAKEKDRPKGGLCIKGRTTANL